MRGRQGGPGDGGFIDVEIVEEDAADARAPSGRPVPARAEVGTAGSPLGTGPAPDGVDDDEVGRTGRSAARRGAWAAVAVALVLVMGANVVESRRTAAEDARMATIPGVVGSLEHPVAQVWESRGWYPITFVDDIMVTEAIDPVPVLEAIDVRTGERLWTIETEISADVHRSCSPWWTWESRTTLDAEITSLACVTADYGAVDPGPTDVEIVDVRTGEVTSTFEVPGRALTQERAGDDLVTAWVDDERKVVVARLVAGTGAEVWRTMSDPVDPELDLETLGAYVDGEVLRVEHQSWTDDGEGTPQAVLAVDVATGALVDGADRDDVQVWQDVVEAPSGYRITTRQHIEGTSTVTVEDPAGTELLELEGWPLHANVDDGSAPEVLLVHRPDGAVAAVDVETGEELWSSTEVVAYGGVLRLRGMIVVAGSTTRALDLRTGETLWTVTDAADAGGVTDGRRVLLARTDDGGGLSAHDLRDGSELWRIPLPGVQQVIPGPGVVIVHKGETLVGLR